MTDKQLEQEQAMQEQIAQSEQLNYMTVPNYNILLEGCDSTGKSSIAAEILKIRPGFKYVHEGPPKNKDEARKHYESTVEQLNSSTGWLYDRAILGEAVYAPIFRGYYPEYMRDLEAKLGPETHLVLVYAKPETVLARFDGKFIKPEQIPVIIAAYNAEWSLSKYKSKLRLCSDKACPASLAKTVIDCLEGSFNANLEGPVSTTAR